MSLIDLVRNLRQRFVTEEQSERAQYLSIVNETVDDLAANRTPDADRIQLVLKQGNRSLESFRDHVQTIQRHRELLARRTILEERASKIGSTAAELQASTDRFIKFRDEIHREQEEIRGRQNDANSAYMQLQHLQSDVLDTEAKLASL